jgi:hypothetical protein
MTNVLPAPDLTVRPDDERPHRMDGTCFYCRAPMGGQHVTGPKECVVVGFRVLEAASVAVWYPIDTYPAGHYVMFWFPNGERGVGGIETALAFPNEETGEYDHGWTHGGANSGSDFSFCEAPTQWAKLPEGPQP